MNAGRLLVRLKNEDFAPFSKIEMKPLQPPDSHHLSAAIGWIGLSHCQEANEELEKIVPGLRAHPDVLEVADQAG
jgi:hypothetical protein